ncbi:MAG: hypothetical protein Q9169_002480 [Polycauliona sp. 2 TL-2023]
MSFTARESLLKSIQALLADAEKLPENIFDDQVGRRSVQRQIANLKDATTTPFEGMADICFQPHQSAAVKIALEGKWFEVLADGNPKTALDIASATGAEPRLIERIMMVLTATHVVNERGPQTYAASPLTNILLDPGWANGIRHFFDHCGPSMINLPGYFQRNGYKVPQDVKTGPFADAWGGRNTWALYKDEPERGKVFDSFMTRWKQGSAKWTDTYPAKSKICKDVEKSKDAILIVDIGGGRGHVLEDFAQDPGHRTGRLIVQDLPAALGDADSLSKQGIETMPYDFFTPQPIEGAKAYYLRQILHDWPDQTCREILSNTVAAMRKGYSKLLIDEVVLPDTDVPRQGAFLDLSMMAIETGTERTSRQWHDLLASVGLRIEKIWSTDSGLEMDTLCICIMETDLHVVKEYAETEGQTLDPELRYDDSEGYILDVNQIGPDLSTKTASDGQTVLIPQPSDDPNDPLNWNQARKHVVLAVIIACTFLPDYGSATGAITLIPQGAEYGITPDKVNHSQSGNQFMVGAGGVAAVMFSAYFGRLPVLFWFMVIATATAAGQAGSHGFNGFFVPRVLNGFFAGAAQGSGLMIIKDMFFLHEHARKINIWQAFVILSPYLGPLLASFMITQLSWRWPFWIYTIESGLCLLAVIVWGEETYYDRRLPLEKQPAHESHLLRLIGIEQWRSRHVRKSFGAAMLGTFRTISRPVVLLANIYYMFTFAWVVGINATLALFLTASYGFGPKQIGFFFFAPIIATILAEGIGHFLHDSLARLYIRRHRGRLDPEARLTVIYMALPFLLTGLVVLGFALERKWHYMVTAVGWGMYVFGTMVVSVGVSAYLLDSYPHESGEVGAWINFSRTAGGFVVAYLQVRWVDKVGAEACFGTQAAVCAAVVPIVVVLQVFGKRMRMWERRRLKML